MTPTADPTLVAQAQGLYDARRVGLEDTEGIWFPGDLKATASVVPQPGWLLCNGKAVSRTDYARLFNAIGTSHGVGDGSTTFNLPDYQGRTFVGAGAGSGLTARTVGTKLGEESHVLTDAERGGGQVSLGYGLQANGPFDGQPLLWQGVGPTAHNNMQPSTVCNIYIKV